MRGKILISILILAMVLSSSIPKLNTVAINCPELRVIFARGSGGEKNVDPNYLEYKNTIEEKLKNTKINYEFIDLDYPAVGVGMDNLETTIGAYIGAGESYKFGDSVNTGVKNLAKLVNNECPNTKYVIGGYSQGAMVVSKSLRQLNPNKIIYAATFGDPKIYLPEGKGLLPAACRGENLSDYRAYVPDCHAYKGLLGSYEPYAPEGFTGKLGTWCNKHDVFCSSLFNISHHTAYIADQIYEDASRVIIDKVTKHFGVENNYSSPHDTAILIDTSGSMQSMINKYREEAIRLAKETFDIGGRVALYDFRDLIDGYNPVEYCDFENCTLESFTNYINNLQLEGGDDFPESLLSASFTTMKNLKWKLGATKSLVVLTDAGFLAPDRDGITIADVVHLSKSIDPVNIYVVTEPEYATDYQDLTKQTDGKVITSTGDFSLMTNEIIERYDSLPRVDEEYYLKKPELEITSVEWLSDNEVKVTFKNETSKALVALNDTIMGLVDGNTITIKDLDTNKLNTLSLAAVNKYSHGEATVVELTKSTTRNDTSSNSAQGIVLKFVIPKAPDTGRR